MVNVIATVREMKSMTADIASLGTLEVRIVEDGADFSRDVMHIKMDKCFMDIWAGEKADVEDLITVLQYGLLQMDKDEES